MTDSRMRSPASRQGGVVLLTGLIFLVVLTMIVLAVMRGSTLEERMAANARNRQLALQAAEAVARDAGATLFPCIACAGPRVSPIDPFDRTAFTAGCTGGYCQASAWQTIDWSDAALSRTFASSASNVSGVASQPRYIVEIIPNPVVFPAKGCPPLLFRVTARGVGADSSVVFVESMYRYQPLAFATGECGGE